jgi:hypothetical protein
MKLNNNPKRQFMLTTAIYMALIFLAATPALANPKTITLPLSIHFVTDLPMQKRGVAMNSWISPSQIRQTILTEVNRIWRHTGITFTLKSLKHESALKLKNKRKLVEYLANAKRDQNGKADKNRIQKLNKLIDWSHHDPAAINVYIVPYLGETSQGNASRKQKRIFIAEWTDKPSKAKQAPERFKLTEAQPFKTGSFSRTLAHEIGHILGLKHPDKRAQIQTGLLMGGKKSGYAITASEIAITRHHAADF